MRMTMNVCQASNQLLRLHTNPLLFRFMCPTGWSGMALSEGDQSSHTHIIRLFALPISLESRRSDERPSRSGAGTVTSAKTDRAMMPSLLSGHAMFMLLRPSCTAAAQGLAAGLRNGRGRATAT